MPFLDPEENQDDVAVLPGLQQPSYLPAGNAVANIPDQRLGVNVSNVASFDVAPNRTGNVNTQPASTRWPRTEPRLGIGHQIVAMGQEPQTSLNHEFSQRSQDQSMNARSRGAMGIGHRILAASGDGLSRATLQSQPFAKTANTLQRPQYGKALTANSLLRHDQPQPQGIFSSFVPAGANPDRSAENPMRFPSGAAQAAQNYQPQVIPVKKTPSRIHQLKPVPEVRPDYRVKTKNAQKQLNRMLRGLTRDMGNPARVPMGIAADGAPKIDVTYLVKAPSRIPHQYESGENFSNVNIGFIKRNEGGTRLQGYVPKQPAYGKHQSGATIGAGFDLGQYNLAELKRFGFSKELTNKLVPFVGLKAQAAKDALAKSPLSISPAEAKQINELVLRSKMNAAAATFNKMSTGMKFSELPWQAQTVIADLWYNMGELDKAARNFWKQVTTGDWEGAYSNLMHFAPKHSPLANRAVENAKLLRDAIDIGRLPSY